jgi:hypothetical protein
MGEDTKMKTGGTVAALVVAVVAGIVGTYVLAVLPLHEQVRTELLGDRMAAVEARVAALDTQMAALPQLAEALQSHADAIRGIQGFLTTATKKQRPAVPAAETPEPEVGEVVETK